jgi:hypothetical protein
MRNTGTATWTKATNFRLGSQAPQDNSIWSCVRVDLPTAASIAPGQVATYTFNIIAPAVAGTYALQARMLVEGFEWFGAQTPIMWIKVV